MKVEFGETYKGFSAIGRGVHSTIAIPVFYNYC